MALGNAGSGQIVPVYTTAEVQSWIGGAKTNTAGLSETILVVAAVIGFLVMAGGIIQYMKQNRNADSGGGDRGNVAIWMIVGGAGLGSLGSIFYFMVRVMSIS